MNSDYDPTNKTEALRVLTEAHDKGEIVTGLFYLDAQKPSFIEMLNFVDDPLATLPESSVRPPKKVLDKVMGLRVSEQDERVGLDLTQHREAGYTIID